MNKDFGQLRFLKSDGSGGKPFVLKAECCSIGSSMNASIRLMDKGHGLLGIHCIIDVDKNGMATLSNKAPNNPVKLNGQNILKKRCLKPGDILTIMDKRLIYENDNIAQEILSSIDQVRNIKTPKNSRMSMVDFRSRRSAMTPEPKRPRRPTLKRKRSNSFSNIQEFDIIPEDDIEDSPFKTPGRRKSIRVKMANSSFTKADVSTSQLVPSKEISTPRTEQKFQVVTPQSTIKPTLRSELLKSLGKPKLPELVKPSEESGSDDIEKRELRTPVAEIVEKSEDLINFNTPANNTSIVIIDSPDEENVPVRSKKSLTKNISIQRLTQNDDSVVVLDSPNSKTPKSMLRAKPKTPSTTVRKTNLILELDKESFSSTPIAESSAIFKQVQFDSLRKSMRASSTFTPDTSPKKTYPKTPRRNENDSENSINAGSSSESEEDNFKTPNNNTPVLSKSTMKQRRSTVKMTDADTTPKAVSPTSVPKSRRSFKNFDSIISDKSSNSSAQSNESLDLQVSTEAISNTDLPDSTSNDESLKYLNSAKSIEYLNEYVRELSMEDNSHSTKVSPIPNMPKRMAVTEQKVTKRRGQKRRSLNLSFEMKQDEVFETSTSSVNTSSFIYIPGDSSKLGSLKVSPKESIKENEDSLDLDTNSSMEIGALNISENSFEKATNEKDESDKVSTPRNQKSDDSSHPKDVITTKVQNEPENDLSNISDDKRIFKTPKSLLEEETRKESSDLEESIQSLNTDLSLVEKNKSVICETPVQDYRRSSIRSSKKVPEFVNTKSTPQRRSWSMTDESKLKLDEDASNSDLVDEENKDVICTTPVPEHQECRRSFRSLKISVDSTKDTTLPEESNIDESYVTPQLEVRRQSVRSLRKSDASTETPQRRSVIVKDTTVSDTPEVQLQEGVEKSIDGKDDDLNLSEVIDFPTVTSQKDDSVDNEDIVVNLTPVQEIPVRRQSRSTKKSIDAPTTKATPRRKSRAADVIDTSIAKIVEDLNETEELVEEDGDEHSTPLQEMQVIRKSLRSTKKIVDSQSTKSTPQRESKVLEDTTVSKTTKEDLNETKEIVEGRDEYTTPVQEIQVRRHSLRTAKKSVASSAVKSLPQRKSTALGDTIASKITSEKLNETEEIVEEKDEYTTPVQEIQVRRHSVRTAKKSVASSAVKSTPQRKSTALGDTIASKITSEKLNETEEIVDEKDEYTTPVQEIQVRRHSLRTTKKSVASSAVKSTPQRKSTPLGDTIASKITSEKLNETEEIVDEKDGYTTPVQEIQVRRHSVRTAKKDVDSPVVKSTPQKGNDYKDASVISTPIQETRRKSTRSTIKVIASPITKPSTPQRRSRLMDKAMFDSPKANSSKSQLSASPALEKNTPVQDIQVRRLSVRSAKRILDSPSTKLTPHKRRTLLKDIQEAELINKNVEDVKERALTPNNNGSPNKGNKISTPKSSAEGKELEVHTPENYNPTGNEDDFLTPAFLLTTKERRRTIKSANRKSLASLTSSAKKRNSGISNVSSNEIEMSPKVVKQLIKTPKHQALDDLSNPLGVEQLMDSPKEQKERENDTRSPKGRNSPLVVKKLQREPLNDLSNPVGVKQLMATPKIQKEPENDLTSPRGIKQLMKTPKVQKGPKDDLRNPLGVKQLMKTPKPQNEPLNDLSSPRGVKQLLATPKIQNDPKDDLSNPLGVKQLMKTPKQQHEPLNDLSSPRGVKQLLRTPKAQKDPKDDLSNPLGVKQLMKTPKPQNEPLNDLSSPRGVKQLLRTPKAQNDPEDDLTNPFGVKQLMASPRVPQNEHTNDLTSPHGVKDLFDLHEKPENNSADLKTQELFHVPSTIDLNVSGVEFLAADDIFPKPLRTYGISPRKSIKEDSLNVSSSTEKHAISATTSPDTSIRKRKTIIDDSETEDDDVTEVNKSVKRAKSENYKSNENESQTAKTEGDESLKVEITSHNKSTDSVKSETKIGRCTPGSSQSSYKNEESEQTSSMKPADTDNDASTVHINDVSIKSLEKGKSPKDKTSTPTAQSRPTFDIPMTPIHEERTPRRGRSKKNAEVLSELKKQAVDSARKSSTIIDQTNDVSVIELSIDLKSVNKDVEPSVEENEVIVIVDTPVIVDKPVRSTRRGGRKAAEEKEEKFTKPMRSTRRGKKAAEVESDINDEDVNISDTPAKSVGRGRKAKELEVNMDASVVSSVDEPVKNTRRGRQPKKQDLEENDEVKTLESSEEVANPVKTTRRGKKATEEKAAASLETSIEVNPVKTTRRGKKVVEEQTAEDETKAVDTKQVVTTRGRGRKAVDVIKLLDDDDKIESLETSADMNKQVKTTRRGKKTVEEQSVEDEETESIDTKPVKASRRGRKAIESMEDVDDKPEKTTRRGNDVKPVKTTRRGRKVAEEEAVEDDDTNSVDLKPATRRGRKVAEAKPAEKVTRGRRKQTVDDTDLEEIEKEEEKPKRAVRGGRKAKTVNQENETEKPKRVSGKKTVHFEYNKNDEESDEEEEPLTITTKGRKRTAKEVAESQPAKKSSGKGRKKVDEDEEEVESVKENSDDEEKEQVTSTKGRKRTAKVAADPQPAKKLKGRGRKKAEVEDVDEEEQVESVKRGKKNQKVEEVEDVPVPIKKATRKRIFSSEDLNVISETGETKGKKTEETLRKSARTRK